MRFVRLYSRGENHLFRLERDKPEKNIVFMCSSTGNSGLKVLSSFFIFQHQPDAIRRNLTMI